MICEGFIALGVMMIPGVICNDDVPDGRRDGDDSGVDDDFDDYGCGGSGGDDADCCSQTTYMHNDTDGNDDVTLFSNRHMQLPCSMTVMRGTLSVCTNVTVVWWWRDMEENFSNQHWLQVVNFQKANKLN
jgi:hypothetical protein